MKIDFYDLFSLHTPENFPEVGGENYTAAVKSRVMENVHANKSKSLRINRIGKAVIAAAAAVVVLVTGTIAASALGLIDLEKIFGGMFRSGTEHLANITAVPQNVTTTGDDRLSFRVLGIAGTETDFVGSIEIKRNDGGVFPTSTVVESKRGFDGEPFPVYVNDGLLNIIDETTAIYNFKAEINGVSDETESIIGRTYTIDISRLFDYSEIVNITDKYDVYIDNEEDSAYYNWLLDNKTVVLDGGWTISFPIEYTPDYRRVNVNEQLSGYGISSSVITEVGYSAMSLDFYLEDVYGQLSVRPNDRYDVSVKLADGKKVTAFMSSGNFYIEGGNQGLLNYYFEEPINIDSIESITIGDIVIPVK
ncbi:MAG: hypothetical protein K2G04_10455 [Oscillospiraceae bacterium]|nr:hypothetical protein [Oscillospiraceae bacterium]